LIWATDADTVRFAMISQDIYLWNDSVVGAADANWRVYFGLGSVSSEVVMPEKHRRRRGFVNANSTSWDAAK